MVSWRVVLLTVIQSLVLSQWCCTCLHQRDNVNVNVNVHAKASKHRSWWTGLQRTLLLGGVTASLTSSVLPFAPVAALAWDDRNRLIAEVWRTVDEYYVDRSFNGNNWFELRQQAVKRQYRTDEEAFTAIKDMLSPLGDKYTRYLTPSQYDALYRLTQAEVLGIGVEIGADPAGQVILQYITENSPAFEAGFQSGDVLLAVNGVDVSSKSEDDVAEVFSNQIGKSLRLKVRRGDSEFERTCERRSLKLSPVRSEIVKANDNDILGLIRIQSFTTETRDEVMKALDSFHHQDPPVNRIVIDLRRNPGGVLATAIDTANLFLTPGKIVVFVEGNKLEEARMTTANSIPSADPELPDITTPCYLLVDRNTASAAEVFTGALQDNLRAKVIGERSFGKGIIQNFQQLSRGGISITTARYETPLHHNIHKVGIRPDISFSCDAASAKDCVQSLLPIISSKS